MVIGQNSDAQKECSLADDAGGDGEPMLPELLAKIESQVCLDAK